ncbi:GAF domain-containing protein [Leisingera daeponensis]|uniref:histidine kinase n=1 Tax=Leisingera daeponensis TaxID=405746 RepID=A0ABS7NHR3_9RHOB|nr:histidine kinase dimerization/phosphoacceptor domain -containing protein [Leisingera daeponensis]MBY6140758.1 GAF domain-containing protein [Leisingera daeponensis]
MKANAHPKQEDRLRALYSFDILDTDREKDFDDIVALAAELCGTAISVVNLIDAERQWFKAETGLGVRETPLETSICSHVILEEDFVEINDTLQDSRMCDNPLCLAEPGLRFYAGALLKTSSGLPLGTLCVLDYQPRKLTGIQRRTLRVLARQVMAQLELRKSLRAEEILRKEADHRVKNSLMSLSAFTRLQQRHYDSADTRTALSRVMARIDAMSRVHELLYQQPDGRMICLKSFLELICGHTAHLAPPGVALQVEACAREVSVNKAVAIGSFVNEFIANSFKHAFPDERPGSVTVRLEQVNGSALRLTCRDDGVGYAAGADKIVAGLGVKIAEVVRMELEGELEVFAEGPGVSAALLFPA